MEAKIEPKLSPRAFQDALGAGLPLEAILASIFDQFLHSPNHKKSCSRCSTVPFFTKMTCRARGSKIDPKITPKIEAKRRQMASEAVSKKGVMLGSFLDWIFWIFQTQGGSTRHERPRL